MVSLVRKLLRLRRRMGQEGQATIEFALTLLLLLCFVFFYVQLGFVMAFANYVQYATFMAARAYLSAGPSDGDQEDRAANVLTKMLKKGGGSSDRWPTIGKGVEGDRVPGALIGRGPQYAAKDKGYSWQEGVRYTFRSKLFLLPLGDDPSSGALELTSESWLGRETSSQQCKDYLSNLGGYFDNGC